MPRCFALIAFYFSTYVSFAYAEKLVLEVVDETGRSLAARVRVRDAQGVDRVSANSLKVPLGPDQWFVTAGSSSLTVPSGEVEIRVEHGPEYLPYRSRIEVVDDQTTTHRVKLKRWIDMHGEGYLCGENHLHVPLPELAPQLVSEGLDFGTSLYWWNGKRYKTALEGGSIRELDYAGRQVPTSVFDYEIEYNWGAVYVVGQPTALMLEKDSSQPNLPLLQQSRAGGALVCYQGGWSREVLLDALLGAVDVVNICNNNFLRHAYQPRSRYSNLLEVDDFPIYQNTAEDMLRMNTETYYRLLNCGLRLAAGAGTATGPKRSPVGYNRCYVRMEGETSYQAFLERWREGRNFVTNGPMLTLQANDKFYPGDTIDFANKKDKVNQTVLAEATVRSPDLIKSFEIVANGRVVYRASQEELEPDGQGAIEIQATLPISEGGWIAARCTAEDVFLKDKELAAYTWGKPQLPRKPSRLKFAHTSPIYVDLNGVGARVESSIAEANAMLEAFANFAREEASEETFKQLEPAINNARIRLSKIAD